MVKTFSATADLKGSGERRFAVDTGYDATEATNKRRAPKTIVKSEDDHLGAMARKTLVATTRDVRRNFSIFRWSLNKHLDFITHHNFRSRSGDRDFDRRLDRWIEKISEPASFDVQGRFSREEWVRMMEAARVVDGDILSVKIAGGYIQSIEGDRIRDPGETYRDAGRWVHGLRITNFGSVDRYSVHRRTKSGGFEFERVIDAARAYLFGYFDRFDQYRGISPTASAVNTLVGLYKGFDYALAKTMVSQLFAFAIYRNAETTFGGGFDEDDEPEATTQYKVDFSKGPNFLDMDPGDKAEFLESRAPGIETASFWQSLIGASLKALDIPYSWYQENYANFFGNRAAFILYQKGAKPKQKQVRDLLNWWTTWRLQLAIDAGELEVPTGYQVDRYFWDWVPEGVPWWNPSQEIGAAKTSIDLKIQSRSEIRKETKGDDWRDVVDELAEEEAYLREKGLSVDAAQ